MEESSEVHPEENEALPEKNKKRTLKTPSQIEALERLYTEHKYPSESIKAQLAEEIGLSEKQVSGWFCHRRLKDKNMLKDETCANGKQDVSSGIIQDRGSVLKQDSCGSTKQGECMPFDPREVESQRFYGQDYPAGDLSYGNRGNYMQPQYHNAVDNTSSGSSSASQGKLFPQLVPSYDMEPMGYSSRSSNHMLMKATGKSKREQMLPSRYQNEIENTAIAAVKRQLGRHYREDGPPLGVNFQSLPPGAFDSPIQDSPNELYYVGDPSSLTVHRNLKEPSHDKGKAKYNRNMRPQGYSGAHLRPNMCEFDLWNEHGRYQSNPKSSLAMHSSHSTRKLSMDGTDEDYMGEASKMTGNMKYEMRRKRGTEGIRSDSITCHPLPCGKKTHELSYPKLEHLNNSSSYMLKGENYNDGRPSNLIVKHNGFLNKEKREHSQRVVKEKKLYRGKTSTECANLKGGKIQQKQLKEKKKRQVNEFLGQEYIVKAPVPRENLMKGYGGVGDTRTSFSENETVATSSMDE